MADFHASLTPITVPILSENTADAIAQFQAGFTANIVTTGNSLLAAYLALKDTDFFAVGDIPPLQAISGYVNPALFEIANERPTATAPDVDWDELNTKLDQLAALIVPSAPSLQTVDVDVPELLAVEPTIVLPSAPDPDVGPAPSNAPSLEEAPTPDAPLIALPDVPTFEDLQLPQAPSFSLPSFDAEVPQNLLTPPTVQFAYVDPGYVSPLHEPLVIKLLADLQNGSYGIEPSDEDALWFRARDRAAQQARNEVAETLRRASATSFPMPQGPLFDAIAQAEQKHASTLSEANRDIALRRSELYVEGRKFTIAQVQGYEKIRIDLYNATQERAINYAKLVVDTGIAIYDAGVRNYVAQLQGYKAESEAFESRMRAELVKAEIFKAQVQAESLRVDFNRAKIEQYRAQLAGIQTVVDLYKSRLQASTLFMQLQQQKLDVFRTQVQSYAERVRAKEAEFGIYQAAIKGQLAGIEVYREQINAYNARLSGTETKARVQLQNNESLLQSYKLASQTYANQLDSFAKQIASRLEEARTKGVLYGADIDAYRAYVGATTDVLKVQDSLNRWQLDANRAVLAAKVEQVRFRLTQLQQSVDLQKDVNKNGIEFLRTALGGAVSGLNSLGVKTEE
jgi:hypothetical protein